MLSSSARFNYEVAKLRISVGPDLGNIVAGILLGGGLPNRKASTATVGDNPQRAKPFIGYALPLSRSFSPHLCRPFSADERASG